MIKRRYELFWMMDTNEWYVICKDEDQAENYFYNHSGPFSKSTAYEIRSALQIKNDQENP